MAYLTQTPKRSSLLWGYERKKNKYTGRVIVIGPIGGYVQHVLHLLLMRKRVKSGKPLRDRSEDISKIVEKMKEGFKIQYITLNKVHLVY
jgi:hypothetical protein